MAAKILIVEDNDRFAALLQQLLSRRGYTVEVAADGIEALAGVARFKPDAVLLDLRLPRLSGLDVLKKIRQAPATRHLPVIVLSGACSGDRHIEAILKIGANAFLEKPCRPGQILAALDKAIPRSQEQARTFAQLLTDAFRSGFSGRYLLGPAGSEHQLTLLNGVPLYLRPGFGHADFGSYLKAKGLIDEGEYDYYRNQAGRNHFVFVQIGVLQYPELLQEKLHYLTNELVSGLDRTFAQVRREQHSFPPGLQPITVNVPQILYQGHRRRDMTGSNTQSFKGLFAAPSAEYFRYINFLSLTLSDRQLLCALDSERPVAQWLPESSDSPLPLLRTLADLGMLRFAKTPLPPATAADLPVRTLFNRLDEESEECAPEATEALESFDDLLKGAVDFEAPEPAAAPAEAEAPQESAVAAQVRRLAEELKGKNYYEMLGITQQSFSFDTLKQNYFSLSRQLGPEVIMQLTGKEAGIAEELLANISGAYNTLSDVVKKERYDEMLGSDKIGLGQEGDDVFQAEVQFQSGKVFIDMEDWDAAEKALREASNADQNNGLVLAHLAWAIYKNPRTTASRAMQDRSKQMLNRALTLERSAEGFSFKGWILLESEQLSLAEAEFNKSLKLNARNSLARKGLRLIQEHKEQEKKGLFRRMFT